GRMSRLSRGMVYGLTGALLSMLAWYIVERCMGESLPGSEILVGVATGLGVLIGYPDRDTQGGMAAVTISLCLIFLAKIVSFARTPPEPTPLELVKHQAVAVSLAHELIDQKNVKDADAIARHWDSTLRDAARQVAAMRPEELDRRWSACPK